MEQVYYLIGFSIFWVYAITISIILLIYSIKLLLKTFKSTRLIIDYLNYRREFEIWIKEKKQ